MPGNWASCWNTSYEFSTIQPIFSSLIAGDYSELTGVIGNRHTARDTSGYMFLHAAGMALLVAGGTLASHALEASATLAALVCLPSALEP